MMKTIITLVLAGWVSTLIGKEAPKGMVWIPGGEFTMGSDDVDAYGTKKPAHQVKVDGSWMDATEVTNAQFKKFVDATGYITIAEKKSDWEEIKKTSAPRNAKAL